MAAFPLLGLLVVSTRQDSTCVLNVYPLPWSGAESAGSSGGLACLYTLGGPDCPAPMQFQFLPLEVGGLRYLSGWMAFTGPATSRLLLLTDVGQDAVHVIDVVGRTHVGYVAAPGTIAGPRGVAARGSLVAVSAWKEAGTGDHVVRLFEGSGASWTVVRVIAGGFGAPGSADGQLKNPFGLRFTGDCMGLAVAEFSECRVSLFRVEDGSFVRHVATGLRGPFDVEECEGGWLVVCVGSHTIEFVDGDGVGQARLGREGSDDVALALVPGLGLVVRQVGGRGCFQVFATSDTIAMASMSPLRVAWMAAMARGLGRRRVPPGVCVPSPQP